jgi:predicted O-linked N-acetylglucosamine transferase (SPINDLY family)
MGVPVLALRGERRAARVAESVLTALGPDLAELLVAKTPEDYVARAVGLLSDLPRLAALRQTIRPRMMASPLRDEAGFVQSLEAALLALAADKAGCG